MAIKTTHNSYINIADIKHIKDYGNEYRVYIDDGYYYELNKRYFESYPLAQNKIELVDITELETLSVSANREVVLKEIKEKGLIPPIVDTATGEVIDGNHRVAVLQELGYKKIPVIDKLNDWVQEAEVYGQLPWNVPEGELAKVKPNALAKQLVDFTKTKSQLTDIWNKANPTASKAGTAKSADLMSEAKKYKTAEEFVEAQGKKNRKGMRTL